MFLPSFLLRHRNRSIANFIVILTSLATILAIGNVVPGYAQARRLVPTIVRTGDCVAPRITTKTIPAGASYHTPFFTNRCGNSEGFYFISINRVEYPLKRIGGSLNRAPFLTGSFVGRGIRVNVKPISIQQGYDQGVESGGGTVSVIVTLGKITEKIPGLLSYGP